MDDPAKAIVAISVFASLAFSVRAIANAFVAYHARDRVAPATLSDERLARIEQSVDAIALEVERISEGQRFTTKLLSERSRPAESERLQR